MNILVAENQPLMLLGIRQVVEKLIPGANITAAETLNKVIKLMDTATFDLMILEISIPGAEKIEVIESIRKKQPSLPILINSNFNEQFYALPFLKAGAQGFISKGAKMREFESAIWTVLKSQVYASSDILQNAFELLIDSKRADEPIARKFSDKEVEIIKLLCQGAAIKEISESVNLSSSSVSNYKRGIYQKLKVDSVIALKAYVDINCQGSSK